METTHPRDAVKQILKTATDVKSTLQEFKDIEKTLDNFDFDDDIVVEALLNKVNNLLKAVSGSMVTSKDYFIEYYKTWQRTKEKHKSTLRDIQENGNSEVNTIQVSNNLENNQEETSTLNKQTDKNASGSVDDNSNPDLNASDKVAIDNNSNPDLNDTNNIEIDDSLPINDTAPVNANNDILEPEKVSEEKSVEPAFGKIKLVDINKLLKPKEDIQMPVVNSRQETVLIISDSEDEFPSRTVLKNGYSPVKHSRVTYRGKKEKPKNVQKAKDLRTKPPIVLKDISSSDLSDNSFLESTKSVPTKNKKERSKSKKVIIDLSSSDTELETKTSNKATVIPPGIDKKFYWTATVPLPRIKAEKLKEDYENQVLNRLCNLETLKRTRTRKENDQSDESSTVENETKRARKSKKTVTFSSDKEVDQENSDKEALEDIAANSPSDILGQSKPDKNSDSLNEDLLDAMVANADESVNEDKGSSSDEEKKKNSNKKGGKDAKEVKEGSGSSGGESSKKKDNTESDEGSNKENGKDTDDEEKEKNKKSKSRKNDKLLRGKICSDSDSEDFSKFARKKKEDMESSGDELTPIKKKQSRRLKKKKQKKVVSDSEEDGSNKSSNSSSDSSSSESDKKSESSVEAKKPKRKRIQNTKDSSDDNDEDKDTRKHIRKVWTKKTLETSTIQAEREERERKARIAEKQKKYNDIFEKDSLSKDTVDEVVLDFDEETKKELLKVDEKLAKHLKPHQARGIQFMWDACFESIKRAKETIGSGCILAHCMGLGKTLQVITLIHTLVKNVEQTEVDKVLVVCPLNTVLNWKSEFQKWLSEDEGIDVYELVSAKQNAERAYTVKFWHENGGVLIIGYEMFRNLTNENNKRIPKKTRETFKKCLLDPGPDLVVCDEGHLLKNEKTSISIAMNKLKTLRRIVLTGTPLQNNLKEYYCMVQFVKPNLLGTFKEYANRFVNPITNGQYTDSTQFDIQLMRRRSHVLHKLLDGIVQRRDYAVLAPFLPPKLEYVLFITLQEVQIKLYDYYLNNLARKGRNSLFVDFQHLHRICTHPRVLLDKSIEEARKRELEDDEESEGSIKDFITDDKSSGHSSSSSSTDEEKSDKEEEKADQPISKRRTRATAADFEEEDQEIEDGIRNGPTEWWHEYCDDKVLDDITVSGKITLLFQILKECEAIGDKILVFSQSLYSLNVIEYFLSKIDDATQSEEGNFCGFSGSWALGLDYFRLDGSSSCDNRSHWCKLFNSPDNLRARLFLISTKAGGLGINLVAANRVIIFDVSWNPSHDIQSIYRVYRFGQTKPTYVYRFVTMGTMEEKIYERQVTKQAISKRVVDEQQIDRHYNQHDLAELYKFDPKPADRPTPNVPKDVLLAEMVQNHENIVYKYHEHQSLLENKEEETLNEEERKAAWDEFENEKKNRITSTSGHNTGMMFPNVSGHILSQAIIRVIRRENPAWDDKTVIGIIPTVVQGLQQDVMKGEITMYNKIMSEIRLLQQIQLQQYAHFQQQQAMRILQQQYQQANGNQRPPMTNNAAGTSQPRPTMTPNEVIDLLE